MNQLRKNIALGVEEKDIDEIKLKNAIKNAQLDDFVNNLENGVESIVGDRGLQISGGQKQRIGIARALYADTEILILDEATSSLDEITEENIMKFIKEIIGNKTIIIISHRDAALKNCSKIIKLKKN